MQSIELDVNGMTCGHCVTAVTQALLGVSGVVHADVSLANNHAHVEHDGTVRLESLISAIEEEGYAAGASVSKSNSE